MQVPAVVLKVARFWSRMSSYLCNAVKSMMQLYPANAAVSLEFNKVTELLAQKCRTDAARERVEGMRFHTLSLIHI